MPPFSPVSYFLFGAIALACALNGIFFLKFYLRTGDRLLRIFGIAFLMMAIERITMLAVPLEYESRSYLYVIRLFAFLLIIVGVIQKNRGSAK